MKKIFPNFLNAGKRLFAHSSLWRRAGFIILLCIGGVIVVYLLYSLAFLGRVYPRVAVGGESFGGLRQDQIVSRLDMLLARAQTTPVTITSNSESTTISPDTISWQIDRDQTVKQLLAVGRSEIGWRSIWQQISAPFHRQAITPNYSYDKTALDEELEKIAVGIDQKAVDASAHFSDHQLVISKEAIGRLFDRQQMEHDLMNRWLSFSASPVDIQTTYDLPKIVLADEDELRSLVEVMLSRRLTLTWRGGKKILAQADIEQLIGFIGQDPQLPATDEGEGQQVLAPSFTLEKARAYLRQLATTIDQPAQEPKLIIKDGVLAVGTASQVGYVVNINLSSTGLAEALSASADKEFPLVADVKSPLVRESDLASLGIKERVGYADTSFAGSPSNRRHNIANGVSLLQSALIKPGEEFSVVSTLGKIDDTTGFLPELVIKENKTVPEYGGGLCQVSTTLFRAALNAGLNITERQNHSYRVSYYEPPVGLDATIYLPRPDLKFVNDTSAHLLVQGKVSGNKVIFELWGTSDGRSSTISNPIVSNVTEPPEPIRTETNTLAKGEEKQIERAHQGATAVVYYTVSRGGQVINKQTFRSVYKAWPARILVGTREDLPS